MTLRDVTTRLTLLAGLMFMPLVHSTTDCEEFNKQVSVDNGVTWHDADDAASAPEAAVGTGVLYRFIVKNCFTNKTCINTVISDPDLGLNSVPVGDGVVDPLEEIIVTKDSMGFDSLEQPDRCETPGDKLNTATEMTQIRGSSTIETMMDDAWVRCVEPELGSLGDRVWEDRNGDGVQNCRDINKNRILGDAGDTGAECDAGIEGVLVTLYNDANCTDFEASTTTDSDGFYLFEDLPEGEYCVKFDKPDPADGFFSCVDAATGIDLGMPLFTTANAGDSDIVDSDADPASGQTGSIVLGAGDTDRTIDAGIVCPVKIGNRVWEDDGDGIQQFGEDDIAGVDVQLFSCGPDMISGTDDDGMAIDTVTTGADGMYMFGGAVPGPALEPGKYYVKFDSSTYPADYSPAPLGDGMNDIDDSDCAPDTGITACTDLSASGAINLNRDCGLVPPQANCDLVLDKSCRIEMPPEPAFDKCDGRLTQFTVEWQGGDAEISGPANDSNGGLIENGQKVTFFGPFDDNDVVVDIIGQGQSEFHTSCSDDDFNDPTDCGKAAGNGKDDDGNLLNLWTLEGFVDKEGRVLNCNSSSDEGFADSCSAERPPAPSCDTTGKPETLTWRYDGGSDGTGSCASSTFDVQKDFECDGAVDVTADITVVDDDGMSYSVATDDEFDMPLDGAKEISLSNAGGTQSFVLHTSCSQPIEAGLTLGPLTLVALDDLTGGVDVTYRYEVTNNGDALTEVFVTDNELGHIGGPVDLASGMSAVFDRTATLSTTTSNTGTASGTLPNGGACSPATASDTVQVDITDPTCNVTIELYKVEDDKIKWKLANSGNADATIETLTISWPGDGMLKKVKFDGSDILKDDLRSSPATILSNEWLKEIKDRTLESGDSGKKLELEFDEKFPLKDDQPSSNFDLTVTFEEGCSVSY